jgi:hypothetical protein
MYASCWILTKMENLPPPTPGEEALHPRGGSIDMDEIVL